MVSFLFRVSVFLCSNVLHIWKTCCMTASCLRSSRPFRGIRAPTTGHSPFYDQITQRATQDKRVLRNLREHPSPSSQSLTWLRPNAGLSFRVSCNTREADQFRKTSPPLLLLELGYLGLLHWRARGTVPLHDLPASWENLGAERGRNAGPSRIDLLAAGTVPHSGSLQLELFKKRSKSPKRIFHNKQVDW